MHRLIRAAICGLMLPIICPLTTVASRPVARDVAVHGGAPPPVTLQIQTGYGHIYRDGAWAPVRVTVRNTTDSTVSGSLQVPQSSASSFLRSSQSFHGAYSQDVVLPAAGTKNVTLFVPGSGIQDDVTVTFSSQGHILASKTDYPMGIDTSTLSIGTLAGSPSDWTWLTQSLPQKITTHIVPLSAATLDAVPEALSNFDIILLTNFDSSTLSGAQLQSLYKYAVRGGSVLLVGGPAWQETLRPLPSFLLPGTLRGSRTASSLRGLVAIGSGAPPAVRSTVSVLSAAHGMVMAQEGAVPLVVRDSVGQGAIEYLAFDPSQQPVAGWGGATALLWRLVTAAAPVAVSRTSATSGFRARFMAAFARQALTNELANVPSGPLPYLTPFALLLLAYLLLIGPFNFLALHLLRRTTLAWFSVPLLAAVGVVAGALIVPDLRNRSVLVNEVGMVTLDSTGTQPATWYVGLAAPLSGTYRLAYQTPFLVQPTPNVTTFFPRFAPMPGNSQNSPLGMTIETGSGTAIIFPDMKTWHMRDVSLEGDGSIQGTVTGKLAVDATGAVSGTIHNGTRITLLKPALVAGQEISYLSTIRPGATITARIRPRLDAESADVTSAWTQLYDSAGSMDSGDFGWGWWDSTPTLPKERTLQNRVSNALSTLRQQQTFDDLGSVVLVGWTDKPMHTITVNGASPQVRSLTLIAVPLRVQLPAQGAFRLPTGVVQAHLADVSPGNPQSNCCGWPPPRNDASSVGPGGYLTYEFDLPGRTGARFEHLNVSVNDQTDGTNRSFLYDWRAGRWTRIAFSYGTARISNPMRFIAPSGQVLLKLLATNASGDLTASNPNDDIQIEGMGKVT